MIAIELRFPTGKYHATPWGRQVNEGAIEWPPSPWRLLRSLLAVWHHKLHEVPEEDMRGLIDALVAPPAYYLPPTFQGHTRHYMPAANDAKTKIVDTFIAVSPTDPVVIFWSGSELESSQASLLSRLLGAMSYFGRAESWVDAELRTDYEGEFNAHPLNSNGVEPSQELFRVLSRISSTDYEAWRLRMLADIKEQRLGEKRVIALQNGKPPEWENLTSQDITKLEASVPTTVFDALHAETNDLRKAGWNRPPASVWVDYVRDREAVTVAPQSHLAKTARPTVARFAIAGAVRSRLTEALWIGERARHYLMGCSKKQNAGHCSSVFSGKESDGEPQRDTVSAHSHAHYLCESSGLNNRGRITHLTVYAPRGFSQQDECALARFTGMWGHDGHDLQLVLLGIAQTEDFGGTDERKGQSPVLASSKVWTSRTPFVPTDHLRIRNHEKRDPKGYAQAVERELERLVHRELERRPWLAQHAASAKVERITGTNLGGTETTWLKFRRQRKGGNGKQSTSHGYGFRLTFAESVKGPISLGYGSHFGLGQFVAS